MTEGTSAEVAPAIARPAGGSDRDDAFRVHVEPEIPVLLRVARRLTGTSIDAEDLVQETLLRAIRAVDRFDGRYPRAWLLTILRNTWKNSLRKRRPSLLRETEEAFAAVPAHGADGRGGAEALVMDATVDGALLAALRDLTPKMREAVVLVDVDGLSYREAAELLGIPEGTVMSRLHRARRRLRQQLSGRLQGDQR